MKKVKRILSIALAVCMLGSMGTSVMAEGVEEDYVVTYRAEEVTDIDELIGMQYTRSNNYSAKMVQNETEGVEQLNVNQLIEKREYLDGTIEEDYIVKSLATNSTRNIL